jgi:hypothetical protein
MPTAYTTGVLTHPARFTVQEEQTFQLTILPANEESLENSVKVSFLFEDLSLYYK